ncbi:MAG TPA: sigma-54 dependent transcriptional regulator [Myxococcales bacterium]|nr:sigma-54 dependent transcriptional regulator [Myxococcales bacterium]
MRETLAPVYVVDDDLSMRESVASLIRSVGLPVETFASATDFLVRSRTQLPGCLVLDVKLPGLSGLDLQQELAKADVQIPIIFLTGYGDIPTSVRAMKSGALEFFTKPFDDEALLAAVRQAIARTSKVYKKKGARKGADQQMVGCSPRFKSVMDRIARVAPTNSTVLIVGDTGTGKELVARAIHAQSDRASRPLVSVNCGAIQPSLIASELFGHEKGSFTGALQQRLGRFELADGGTIFLDEIGDLPADTQVALLRVLQEREFERVGGTQTVQVDVRVIAATNRDLSTAIAEGKFRSDLFYRLNVFPIQVPALRERKEDIPLLVEHFLRLHAASAGREIRSVDEKTMEMLQRYPWPGNIRELQNVIERWAIICDTDQISMDESWLPREPAEATKTLHEPSGDEPVNMRKYIEEMERELIGRTMTAVAGNQSEAARRLGVSRGSLIVRLKKYGPVTG